MVRHDFFDYDSAVESVPTVLNFDLLQLAICGYDSLL
jgi:hypothetical protein